MESLIQRIVKGSGIAGTRRYLGRSKENSAEHDKSEEKGKPPSIGLSWKEAASPSAEVPTASEREWLWLIGWQRNHGDGCC